MAKKSSLIEKIEDCKKGIETARKSAEKEIMTVVSRLEREVGITVSDISLSGDCVVIAFELPTDEYDTPIEDDC